MRATAAALGPNGRRRDAPAALPAVQYLVDACHAEPPPLPSLQPEPIGRVGRVIELFERQMVAQRATR